MSNKQTRLDFRIWIQLGSAQREIETTNQLASQRRPLALEHPRHPKQENRQKAGIEQQGRQDRFPGRRAIGIAMPVLEQELAPRSNGLSHLASRALSERRPATGRTLKRSRYPSIANPRATGAIPAAIRIAAASGPRMVVRRANPGPGTSAVAQARPVSHRGSARGGVWPDKRGILASRQASSTTRSRR